MFVYLYALDRPSLEFVLENTAVNIDYFGILTCILKSHYMLFAADDVLVIGAYLLNVVSAKGQLLTESYGHILANACIIRKPVLWN